MKISRPNSGEGAAIIPDRRPWLKAVMLLTVLLIALYLRMDFISSIAGEILQGDARNYHAMVTRWLDQGVYAYVSADATGDIRPNAYITPGYPVFLAIIYKITNAAGLDTISWVRYAQVLLSLLSILLVMLIGLKMYDSKVAAMAGLLMAFYPPSIWSCGVFLTEALFLALFLGAIYLIILGLERPRRYSIWLLCALVMAAAVLTRPVALILLPIIFLFTWPRKSQNSNATSQENGEAVKEKRRFEGAFKIWGIVLLGFIAGMMPWWLRNWNSLHQFIWLATQTANPMIAGLVPYFQADTYLDSLSPGDPQLLKKSLTHTWEAFTANPLLYLQWFTGGKIFYLYGFAWNDSPPRSGWLVNLCYMHQPVILWGTTAMLFMWRRPLVRLLIAVIALYTLFQLLFVPMFRYGFPAYPLFALLCSLVFFNLLDTIKKHSTLS